MDSRSFKDLVAEGPKAHLLDAIDGAQEHSVILPLLETELQRSSVRLRRLKEYRNSLVSPVYSLQPEILSTIFFIYAKDGEELYNLKWTRLLLVCRRWYSVAKDVQSLWSFIEVSVTPGRYIPNRSIKNYVHRRNELLDAQDVRRIETQRSRAGLRPLSINMRVYGSPSEVKRRYVSMFWTPASLTSLNVAGEHPHIHAIIHSMANALHPTLKELTLNLANPLEHDQIVRTQASLDVLLRTNAPNLQHLLLTGLVFDMTLIRDLRTLRISYHSDMPKFFSLQDIIAAIGRCPRLEVLAIVLPLTSQSPDAASLAPISMSHLSTMFVQSSVSLCTGLLQTLTDMPGSAKILVSAVDTANGPSTTTSAISVVASSIGQLASSETAPAIRSILINQPTPHPMAIFADGVHRSRLGVVGQKSPHRHGFHEHYRWLFAHEDEETSHIGLETDVAANTEGDVLLSILQTWPVSKVTHLDLRMVEVSASSLTVLLANLPSVTTVIVKPHSPIVRDLLSTLRAHIRDHGQRIVGNIVFDARGLKYIKLRGGVWADTTPQPSSDVRIRQNMMRTLLYCAEAARAGVPLDTVEIVNDPQESQYSMVDSTGETAWSELYRDLVDGFVYEGVLHSGRGELDGTKRDSFAVADD